MPKANQHRGGSFDDFLREEGVFEEVQARALKRALTEQIDASTQAGSLINVPRSQGAECGASEPVRGER